MEIVDQNEQPFLEHVGFIHSQTNWYTCKGGDACAVIYSRIWNQVYVLLVRKQYDRLLVVEEKKKDLYMPHSATAL